MSEVRSARHVTWLALLLLTGCTEPAHEQDPVGRDIRDTQRCEAAGMVATRGKGLQRRMDGGIICEPDPSGAMLHLRWAQEHLGKASEAATRAQAYVDDLKVLIEKGAEQ